MGIINLYFLNTFNCSSGETRYFFKVSISKTGILGFAPEKKTGSIFLFLLII
jgi:hypothetical protein